MTLYYIILIHFLIYLFLDRWSDAQKKKLFYLVTFVLIFIVFGMRNITVGIDTETYFGYFNLYKGYSLKELLFGVQWFKKFEPAIIVLFKFVQLWSDDPRSMLIFAGLLYAVLFVWILVRLEPRERYDYAFLFFGMYTVCSGMNILRQAMALVVFVHAVLFFRKDKKLPTVIVTIIAFLFHRSIALVGIMMIAYLFFGRNGVRARLMKWGLAIGTISIIFLYQYIFTALGLQGYISNEGSDVGIYNIVLVALIYIYWRLKRSDEELNKYDNIQAFYESSMLFALFSCVFAGFIAIFTRFTSLMLPVIIFPCLLQENENKKSNQILILRIVLIAYILLYFSHNLSANIGGVVPFEFYHY